MIKIEESGSREVILRLEKYDEAVLDVAREVVTRGSRRLVRHIVSEHLRGGTTRTKLARRTGHLTQTTTEKKTQVSKAGIVGGVDFGAKYAGVHVGPKGQTTVINPKRAKFLTIPLDAAKTAAGVARGSARDFENAFFIRSKAGNLLLVQRRSGSGGIVPLFVLKRQVSIQSRVHPEDISKKVGPEIVEDLERKINEIL